jgi:hypothetical protein
MFVTSDIGIAWNWRSVAELVLTETAETMKQFTWQDILLYSVRCMSSVVTSHSYSLHIVGILLVTIMSCNRLFLSLLLLAVSTFRYLAVTHWSDEAIDVFHVFHEQLVIYVCLTYMYYTNTALFQLEHQIIKDIIYTTLTDVVK